MSARATLEDAVENPERSPEREEPRQHNRQEILARHEEWVLANPLRERAVLLDATGRVITRKEDDPGSVLWTETALRPLYGKVDLITHNHPSRYPLGHDDLAMAMAINAREVNAVTLQLRYRLARRTDFWPERELLEAVETEMRQLAMEAALALAQGRVTEEQVDLALYDALWRRTARRFPDRLTYEVERRT